MVAVGFREGWLDWMNDGVTLEILDGVVEVEKFDCVDGKTKGLNDGLHDVVKLGMLGKIFGSDEGNDSLEGVFKGWLNEGTKLGLTDDNIEGDPLNNLDGFVEDWFDGTTVGLKMRIVVGIVESESLECWEGTTEGEVCIGELKDGVTLGIADNIVEGDTLDCLDGVIEDCVEGINDGITLGIIDGNAEDE